MTTNRGSAFLLCERSRIDPRYPRYPALPVHACRGYELDDGAAADDHPDVEPPNESNTAVVVPQTSVDDGRPTLRRAARVLLVDERDRVLLVRVVDPASSRTWWATPGGGLDPDESFEAAARREIAEETGLTEFDLGPCVWTREHRGRFMGNPFHVQERIFFARVKAFEPDTAGFTELERQVQVDWRWWTLAELESADAEFAPRSFARSFGRLLALGPSDAPIDVGV